MAYFFGENILYNSIISNFKNKVFTVARIFERIQKMTTFKNFILVFKIGNSRGAVGNMGIEGNVVHLFP